jgi:ferric-dicitrate binding protein FerR (iron transport regulator)
MDNYSYYKRMISLILGDLGSGLTKDEKKELDDWLSERSENRLLYDRLVKSGNFLNWKEKLERFDDGDRWEHVISEVRNEKRRSIRLRVMKYAAIFILPLLAAAGIYFYYSGVNQEDSISGVTTEIKPGESKAVLVLNDGEAIILDSSDKFLLHEKDGTEIHKEEGRLNYSTSDLKKTKSEIFNTIRIPRGGEYHLKLSDGTRVSLNAQSEFIYPVHFNEDIREVTLTGEAFFEVAPSNVPFIVRTKGMVVEVLGTTFNLNAYENTDEVVTTLVEGKLKVGANDKAAGSRVIYPNEQAVFRMSRRKIEVSTVDVNLYTAWRKGELIFYNMRLEDIMTSLTRWYSAEVFYLNPSVKELRFSGSLNRYENINQILDIIASTQKVGIEINKTTILFREK